MPNYQNIIFIIQPVRPKKPLNIKESRDLIMKNNFDSFQLIRILLFVLPTKTIKKVLINVQNHSKTLIKRNIPPSCSAMSAGSFCSSFCSPNINISQTARCGRCVMNDRTSLENLLHAFVSYTEATLQQKQRALPNKDTETPSVSWITKEKYCELSGLSNGRIRGHIQRAWQRGTHFQIIGKTTMINLQEVEQWWQQLNQPASITIAEKSASASRTKENVTPKSSTATSTRKLTLPPRYAAETK